MSLPLSEKENELGILSFTTQVSFPSITLFGKKSVQLDPIFPNYGWHTRCHCWRLFEPTNLVKAYNTQKSEYCRLCFFRWRNWGTRRQLSDGHLTIWHPDCSFQWLMKNLKRWWSQTKAGPKVPPAQASSQLLQASATARLNDPECVREIDCISKL